MQAYKTKLELRTRKHSMVRTLGQYLFPSPVDPPVSQPVSCLQAGITTCGLPAGQYELPAGVLQTVHRLSEMSAGLSHADCHAPSVGGQEIAL